MAEIISDLKFSDTDGVIRLCSAVPASPIELRLFEATNNGTNYVALRPPTALGSDVTLTLPSSVGSAGQVLTSDGLGGLSFTTVATTSPYDVAGSVLGLPAAGITVFKFAVGRAFTLNPAASTHVALSNTDPATGTTATFTIQKRPIGGGPPSSLGTITFAPAALTGIVTFTPNIPIPLLVGEDLEIFYTTADSGGTLGFFSFTFRGQI